MTSFSKRGNGFPFQSRIQSPNNAPQGPLWSDIPPTHPIISLTLSPVPLPLLSRHPGLLAVPPILKHIRPHPLGSFPRSSLHLEADILPEISTWLNSPP